MFDFWEVLKFIAIVHIVIFTSIVIYTVIIVRLTNWFINLIIWKNNNKEIIVKNINDTNIESWIDTLWNWEIKINIKRFLFYTGFIILTILLLLVIFKWKLIMNMF